MYVGSEEDSALNLNFTSLVRPRNRLASYEDEVFLSRKNLINSNTGDAEAFSLFGKMSSIDNLAAAAAAAASASITDEDEDEDGDDDDDFASCCRRGR